YLLGQAPGRLEGLERRPWRGRAGQTLRRWLGMDEETFFATFYCAAVTRCYPGKSPAGRGDPPPTPRRPGLCPLWPEWGLPRLRPELILTAGGLAARRLLGLRSLSDAVGTVVKHENTTAIPLPHPSGASGWLNEAANRERLERALALVRAELQRLGAEGPG